MVSLLSSWGLGFLGARRPGRPRCHLRFLPDRWDDSWPPSASGDRSSRGLPDLPGGTPRRKLRSTGCHHYCLLTHHHLLFCAASFGLAASPAGFELAWILLTLMRTHHRLNLPSRTCWDRTPRLCACFGSASFGFGNRCAFCYIRRCRPMVRAIVVPGKSVVAQTNRKRVLEGTALMFINRL